VKVMAERRGQRYQRILGTYDAGRPGPTILINAGIHGNEPAGVHAALRFLGGLRARRLQIAGKVVAMAGNLTALERGVRYVDRDLNRQWSPARIGALLEADPAEDRPEDREQREMLSVFAAAERDARGPLVFLDLHSSSGESPPFTVTADTLANRRMALSLPVPLILGLEEIIDAAVLEWFNVRGHVALTIEGGQHEGRATVDHHEAALWLALVAAGSVNAEAIVDLDRHREVLARGAAGAPPIVELRYRHAIAPADGFAMNPGFKTFDSLASGQVVARDRRGDVRSPGRGRMLLPLYQGQGDDGYFLGRDVRPLWLWIAAALRRLRADVLLPLLPGVRRDRGDPDTLLATRRIARFFTVQIFHLLGFRKQRERGEVLVFSRRRANAAARSLPWRGPIV
jgi:succinylglutamate desuccinylase